MEFGSTYRLSLAPELGAFIPEIDYVCRLLEDAYRLKRDDAASCLLHYGPAPPAGALAIPERLFSGAVTVSDDGLYLRHGELDRIASSLLPKHDAREFDAIGLVFLLVSRLEERGYDGLDHYRRYPFSADFQYRHGLYGRPSADEALAAIARLVTGKEHPHSATRYRVHLTHDVDRLKEYHRPTEPLRYAAGDLFKRHKPFEALGRLRAYASSEPWRSFNRLMTQSEQFGLRSHFYFMGPSEESRDSPYAITMQPLLKRVADAVEARGHGIGFHPGYGTAVDADRWQSQHEGLEAVLGRKIREGRQHMLAYQADRTPDIWEAASMASDFTLAYPELDGFRNGSCRVLPAYSLVKRKTLQLRHGSTAIMDFGMFGGKYRDTDLYEALASCRAIAQQARLHGGTLTVLQHAGRPIAQAARFYEALLREIT
jgi:hypothetical protein